MLEFRCQTNKGHYIMQATDLLKVSLQQCRPGNAINIRLEAFQISMQKMPALARPGKAWALNVLQDCQKMHYLNNSLNNICIFMDLPFKKKRRYDQSTVSIDSAESIEVNMDWLLPWHGCYRDAYSEHGVKVKELPANQMIIKHVKTMQDSRYLQIQSEVSNMHHTSSFWLLKISHRLSFWQEGVHCCFQQALHQLRWSQPPSVCLGSSLRKAYFPSHLKPLRHSPL